MSTENLALIFEPSRLARATDPDTSHAAAQAASVKGPNQRIIVWNTLNRLREATDYEIALAMGILRSSAGKRRQELVELGLVEATDKRRLTDTGSTAIVWRVSSSYSSGCPF